MSYISELKLLLKITRSYGVARRYFVVNGFDGALTMLGVIIGFYVSGADTVDVALNACLGAAVALTVSGLTSAYMSEAAERKKALSELEAAMITDLGESAHGQAARLIPFVIALVNGLSPLLISMVIITPLWIDPGIDPAAMPLTPFEAAIATAFFVLFLLGAFLGKVSGTYWLWSGMRTLLIALITAGLIWGVSP